MYSLRQWRQCVAVEHVVHVLAAKTVCGAAIAESMLAASPASFHRIETCRIQTNKTMLNPSGIMHHLGLLYVLDLMAMQRLVKMVAVILVGLMSALHLDGC